MPISQQPTEGQLLMEQAILRTPEARVVDVGAGSGKWGRILRGRVREIIALEAWKPYVNAHGLHRIYDRVLVMDARDEKVPWDAFDVAIFGDILEHMPRVDATALVERLRRLGLTLFLTVPITPCVQNGAAYGNPYETHCDQWTDKELRAEGWEKMHEGPNPRGLVTIGTYRMNGGVNVYQRNRRNERNHP